MITPIKAMTINQIIARQDDLLVSVDDVKAIAKNERAKALDEVDKYLRELSDIKSGCGEWIEHHDAELMRRTRQQEMNFVERKCKELGIDYTQIYTCNSTN